MTTVHSAAVPSAPAISAPQSRDGDQLVPEGLGFLLGLSHRARRRQWEARLTDLGLTAPQAAMLRLVAADPGHGVRHLARRLGTDPMNAQRIIETLLAGGLCRALRDPADARRRPLHPTARGRRLAEKVAERAHEVERQLAESLGDEVYQSLTASLRAVIELDTRPDGDLELSEKGRMQSAHRKEPSTNRRSPARTTGKVTI